MPCVVYFFLPVDIYIIGTPENAIGLADFRHQLNGVLIIVYRERGLASVERQYLIYVLTPVNHHIPGEIVAFYGGKPEGGFHALVLNRAAVYAIGGVAGSRRNIDRQDLVALDGMIIISGEAYPVLEKFHFQAQLVGLILFRDKKLVIVLCIADHHGLAVDRRIEGIGVVHIIIRGVAADLCVVRPNLTIGYPAHRW